MRWIRSTKPGETSVLCYRVSYLTGGRLPVVFLKNCSQSLSCLTFL